MSATGNNLMPRLGAAFYVLWGLVHLYAAWLGFQITVNEALAQAKLEQGAWNLGFIALLAIVIAVFGNWRNSMLAYLLNLVMISVTDIGFLIFVYGPGLSSDLIGPALWILGAIFSTLGILKKVKDA